MPVELIKCSGAVGIYPWKGSGHDIFSGMFKDIFTDFALLRPWSRRRTAEADSSHGKGEAVRNLHCTNAGSFMRRSSAVGFLRVLKESAKLLARLGFHGAEMGHHVPRGVC